MAREHFLNGHEHRLEEMRYGENVLRAQAGRWSMTATQPEGDNGYPSRFPTIDLDVSTAKEEVMLSLTTGEARVLARQLTHLADRVDLQP